MRRDLAVAALCIGLLAATPVRAQEGNLRAQAVAESAPPARKALRTLIRAARAIHDPVLRRAAVSALDDRACLAYRAGLGEDDRAWIVDRLIAGRFAEAGDRPRLMSGLFPPVVADGSPCPRRVQSFLAAPGGNAGSHHDWPGGLAVHEAFNLRQARDLAQAWRDEDGVRLDRDLLTAATIWHDWGKPLVFQWTPDGSEPEEVQIAGTGAHHILALAEAMRRGLPPRLIRTMACAHAAPSGDDAARVETWLKAAAIIARRTDTADLGGPWPAECFVETLSDQNWLVTEPAARAADATLVRLAPRFGLAPGTAEYNWRLRLPALARVGALRLWTLPDATIERRLRAQGIR